MCKFIMKIMMIRTLWGLKPLQGYIHLRTVYRLWSDIRETASCREMFVGKLR